DVCSSDLPDQAMRDGLGGHERVIGVEAEEIEFVANPQRLACGGCQHGIGGHEIPVPARMAAAVVNPVEGPPQQVRNAPGNIVMNAGFMLAAGTAGGVPNQGIVAGGQCGAHGSTRFSWRRVAAGVTVWRLRRVSCAALESALGP